MLDNEKKKGEDDDTYVDIDDLMNKAKEKILDVYKSKNNTSTVAPEVNSKSAI